MHNPFKYIIAGFVLKTLVSFDDVTARIPVIAHFAKSRRGRIAFALGNLLAVTLVIFLVWSFAETIKGFKNINEIAAGLILILSLIVYFDLFGKHHPRNIKKKARKTKKQISGAKFLELSVIGFGISLITLLDDFIVLTPIFLTHSLNQIFAILGIYISTFIQVGLMVYFGKKIAKLKRLREISTAGLLILAVLIYFQIF